MRDEVQMMCRSVAALQLASHTLQLWDMFWKVIKLEDDINEFLQMLNGMFTMDSHCKHLNQGLMCIGGWCVNPSILIVYVLSNLSLSLSLPLCLSVYLSSYQVFIGMQLETALLTKRGIYTNYKPTQLMGMYFSLALWWQHKNKNYFLGLWLNNV